MDIRPGLSIKIVVDVDHVKETTETRNSMVYDVIDETLTIAQTYPPILKSRINKPVILTYLARENGEPVRYGFDADIIDMVNDYQLSVGNTTQAVILRKKSGPVQHNLRLFFRIQPLSSSGIDMTVYRKPVNVLDISIGGVKISHDRKLKFEHGKIVNVSLSIDGGIIDTHAVVIRTWAPAEERMAKSLEFVALEFIDTSMQFKNILSKKIIDIQRELRFRELS